jgi:hypothetical protein
VGTSKWWILAASIVDSMLVAGPGQLDATNDVGISSWRVVDAMGTSSWRATDVMGVMGAALATSALAS